MSHYILYFRFVSINILLTIFRPILNIYLERGDAARQENGPIYGILSTSCIWFRQTPLGVSETLGNAIRWELFLMV